MPGSGSAPDLPARTQPLAPFEACLHAGGGTQRMDRLLDSQVARKFTPQLAESGPPAQSAIGKRAHCGQAGKGDEGGDEECNHVSFFPDPAVDRSVDRLGINRGKYLAAAGLFRTCYNVLYLFLPVKRFLRPPDSAVRRNETGFRRQTPLRAPGSQRTRPSRPGTQADKFTWKTHIPVPTAGRSAPRVPVFQRHNRKGRTPWRLLPSPCSN